MHVCIDYRPALHQGTGVGTYVRGLIGGLASACATMEVTAFTASWRHRAPDHLSKGARIVDTHFPVRLLDWLWHRHQWPPIECWVNDVDIVHSPSPMTIPSRRAKQIVTVHDCYFLRHPEHVLGPVRRDYVPLARQAAANADAVIAVSETTANEVVELLQVPRERIQVTPLGVDEIYRRPPPAAPQRKALLAKLGVEDPFLLFVGTLEPRKDLATLLRAFATLLNDHPETRLVIAGTEGLGWRELWDSTPAAIQQQVVLLPHQPASMLASLYASAIALTLPSHWEGFGLTAIEAMAVGTPVVASRAGALPEVLSEAAIWCEPGNDAELAERWCELIEAPEQRAGLVAAGQRHVERYRWERTAKLTHQLYMRLLEN